MIRNSFKNKSEFFILQTFCKNRTSHWSKYIEICVCVEWVGVVCLGGPFYQDNSSESSSIMNDEFGEHLTKDLQKVKRFKDFFLESIPPYRISPHPSDSQIHVDASSLQFTSLIFQWVQVRGLGWSWQKLHCVLSDTFLWWYWCLIWIAVLMEDPTTAHNKISSRTGQV